MFHFLGEHPHLCSSPCLLLKTNKFLVALTPSLSSCLSSSCLLLLYSSLPSVSFLPGTSFIFSRVLQLILFSSSFGVLGIWSIRAVVKSEAFQMRKWSEQRACCAFCRSIWRPLTGPGAQEVPKHRTEALASLRNSPWLSSVTELLYVHAHCLHYPSCSISICGPGELNYHSLFNA